MSNWFKKSDSLYKTHERFNYEVTVSVWVPQGMGEEESWTALVERLKRINGSTGIDTPDIDGNISVDYIKQI